MRKLILPVAALLALSLPAAVQAHEPTMEWYAVSRTPAETAEAIRRWSFGPAAEVRPLRRVVRGSARIAAAPARVVAPARVQARRGEGRLVGRLGCGR